MLLHRRSCANLSQGLCLRLDDKRGSQHFLCEADELFYGGEAGGGKTDLGIGLALTAHKRSLLLRRINKDTVKIKPRIEEILGHDNGYNGQLQRWRLGDRQIDSGSPLNRCLSDSCSQPAIMK
jgi:hypothetical protein